MIVPCPKLDALVQRAAGRGAALVIAGNEHASALLTSHPDGSIRETLLPDPAPTVLDTLVNAGFPLTADAVCLTWNGTDAIDGTPVKAAWVLATERGTDQAYLLAAPFEKRWMGPPTFAELRLVKRRARLLPAPDFKSVAGSPLDPLTILAALRDRESIDWAIDRLRALGSAAESWLETLRLSSCSLDRVAAEWIAELIASDANPGAPVPPANLSRVQTLFAQHPDTPMATSWMALELTEGTRLEEQQAAARHEAAMRGAPEAITREPRLSEFWERLEQLGWFEGHTADDMAELRVALQAAVATDPANLHYALATVVFADDEVSQGNAATALEQFARGSRGRFAPQDVTERAIRSADEGSAVSFTFPRRRRRITIERGEGVYMLQEAVNDVLASVGVNERFLMLPAADDKPRLAFIDPATYARAVAANAIPPHSSSDDEGRPRRLRRVRGRKVLRQGPAFARPLVEGTIILMELEDKSLVRLDPPDLRVVWHAPGGSPVRIAGERVVARQIGPAVLRVLTLDRGELLWESPVNPSAPTCVWRDQLVVAGDEVTFFELESGEEVQRRSLGACDRVEMHHGFLLCEREGRLKVIDLETWRPLWEGSWPPAVTAALARQPDGVTQRTPVGNDRILVVKSDNRISMIRFDRQAESPELLWSMNFVTSQQHPVLHGGRLFAFRDGRFGCVDLETGQVIYDVIVPDARPFEIPLAAPLVAGDRAIVSAHEGLRIFRVDDGALVARYDGRLPGAFPLVLDDRVLFIGSGGVVTEFR